MKNPNGYGCIKLLSGSRRRPYCFVVSQQGKQKVIGYFATKFAQYTPNNSNDDLWNNDVIMYFTRTTVKCGGEGRNYYHIGIGV